MNDYDPKEAQLLQRCFPYGLCAHSHTHTLTHTQVNHRVNCIVALIQGWPFPCKLTHEDWKVVEKKKTKIITKLGIDHLYQPGQLWSEWRNIKLAPLCSLWKQRHILARLQVLTITFLLARRKLELCREWRGHWISHARMIKVYFRAERQSESKVLLLVPNWTAWKGGRGGNHKITQSSTLLDI